MIGSNVLVSARARVSNLKRALSRRRAGLTSLEADCLVRLERSYFDNRSMLQLKQSLCSRLGPKAGFAVWRAVVPRELFPDVDYLEVRPLRPLRGAAQNSTFREVDPGGAEYEIAVPKVIGEGDHHPLRSRARALYVTCLTDAFVRSGSSVVVHNGNALLDFERTELSDAGENVDFDPSVFAFRSEGQEVWLLRSTASEEIAEAFSLYGWTARAFGHWLTEYLPRYVMAVMEDALPPVPVLINQNMPSTHLEALSLLLPEGCEVLERRLMKTAHVKKLWLSSCARYPAMLPSVDKIKGWEALTLDPRNAARVFQEMARQLDKAVPLKGRDNPRRVYLARKLTLHRRLVNAAEIEEIARRDHFAIIYPEDLSFAEQFRLVRDADVVVGPEGSAMYICALCRPGTKVGILNHTHTENVVLTAGVLDALNVDVTVLTGPVSVYDELGFLHFSDYTIEPLAFRAFLHDWL